MKIVMMGTGPFAVPTFEALLDSQHTVVALVTRPVPEQRRKRKSAPNPMLDVAIARELPHIAPQDINTPEAHEQLREMNAELFVVCDYGQILSNQTLELTRLGGINLHGSLLPKYRGAAPVNWAILEGDEQTGATVIHMTPGLDAGPCLTKVSTPIDDEDDAITLEQRLSQLGVQAVLDAIDMLSDWDGTSPLGEIQDPQLVTKARRLRKEDGRVDWTLTARQVFNRVRGLKPWPASYCAWTNPKGQEVRIILDSVRVRAGDSNSEPGQVVTVTKNELHIQTGDGLIEILTLQPAGKKLMLVAEFLRGYQLQVGDRL